jgi:hypothetical protein
VKLAVMQPYVFPYLGYLHLMSAVDEFILFDDVQFIARGWIHRNQILVHGKPHVFTIPVQKHPRETPISEVRLTEFERFCEKFFKTLEAAYRKASFYDETRELVVRAFAPGVERISMLAERTLILLCEQLGIGSRILRASSFALPDSLRGVERILKLCELRSARTYVNASGGTELYRAADFESRGIELRFVESRFREYPQFSGPFVPHLSILDVLMFNGREGTRALLKDWELRAAPRE